MVDEDNENLLITTLSLQIDIAQHNTGINDFYKKGGCSDEVMQLIVCVA